MAKQDSEELGMSGGKARALLLSSLLLHFARLAHRDSCFRCGKKIKKPLDLSMDHKKSWRGIDVALYWDLNNVALSHKLCNRVDRPGRHPLPKGMSWCTSHREMHPVKDFGPGQRWNGLAMSCRVAERERARKYAARNPRQRCPECGAGMRKTCRTCGYDMPMKDYMALRRKEGVSY